MWITLTSALDNSTIMYGCVEKLKTLTRSNITYFFSELVLVVLIFTFIII